jgi:hypothetical protein
MNAHRTVSRSFGPALGLSLVLGVALLGCRVQEKPPARDPDLDGWDTPHLIRSLESGGLHLRPIPVTETGPIHRSVYLTGTDRGWMELNDLPKVPEQIDRWHGTVYCEEVGHAEARKEQTDLWGDCCLCLGPFVFFGDRQLLGQIRDVLMAGPPR